MIVVLHRDPETGVLLGAWWDGPDGPQAEYRDKSARAGGAATMELQGTRPWAEWAEDLNAKSPYRAWWDLWEVADGTSGPEVLRLAEAALRA